MNRKLWCFVVFLCILGTPDFLTLAIVPSLRVDFFHLLTGCTTGRSLQHCREPPVHCSEMMSGALPRMYNIVVFFETKIEVVPTTSKWNFCLGRADFSESEGMYGGLSLGVRPPFHCLSTVLLEILRRLRSDYLRGIKSASMYDFIAC